MINAPSALVRMRNPKMDKKIKKIYGKAPSEMTREELRVVIAEYKAVIAYEEHCVAVAEVAAAHKAAKKAKCSEAFWPGS
jgi:metal-responsive CopG/Arc/MetJ family transcriptional regulator